MSTILNWEKDWEEKTLTAAGGISDSSYWNKRAADYSAYIETSDYEHGKKIRELFFGTGLLDANSEALDIAAGPGSVTIPVAQAAARVTAVEPASEMVGYLKQSAEKKGLFNIEVVNSTWQQINDAEWKKKFDLVVCSNAVWHFADIGEQLMRMNGVSRGYCCIANGANDDSYGDMYRRLRIQQKGFDRFLYLYNILFDRGIVANVAMIDLEMKRSLDSARKMWELLLGKYREPDDEDKKIIQEHLAANCRDGFYYHQSKMALVWWEAI